MSDKYYTIYAIGFMLCLAGYFGFEKYLDHEMQIAKLQHECPALEGELKLELDVNGEKQEKVIKLESK